MRISDWSSDVCSSDLDALAHFHNNARAFMPEDRRKHALRVIARQREGIRVTNARRLDFDQHLAVLRTLKLHRLDLQRLPFFKSHSSAHIHYKNLSEKITDRTLSQTITPRRSEEHTSELQSLMRTSYAVFCLKKKKTTTTSNTPKYTQ